MPIEIRRFGVGHRRAVGPAGTTGITSQTVHSDARGSVAELAFSRGARIEPHSNPNSVWFIVIEGGGWVLVGDEKTRIAAGEAALWPAGEVHGAWTEHSEMRAFLVEFAGADDSAVRGILEGEIRALEAGGARAEPAIGALAEQDRPSAHDPSAGEPL
ncbi:MAG TPA: cupin domain-containing protein [Clostridia bacterium]|nr:cupin domain-containing protein [Clostridia bacterium]